MDGIDKIQCGSGELRWIPVNSTEFRSTRVDCSQDYQHKCKNTIVWIAASSSSAAATLFYKNIIGNMKCIKKSYLSLLLVHFDVGRRRLSADEHHPNMCKHKEKSSIFSKPMRPHQRHEMLWKLNCLSGDRRLWPISKWTSKDQKYVIFVKLTFVEDILLEKVACWRSMSKKQQLKKEHY